MIKKNTIFLDGRKIGTYKAVLTAGSGHIDFNGFEPYEPRLTDNQQVVLEWLKQYREEQGENPLNTVSTLIDMYCADPAGGEVPLPSNVKEAYKKLNDEQEFQVLAAFAEWGIE